MSGEEKQQNSIMCRFGCRKALLLNISLKKDTPRVSALDQFMKSWAWKKYQGRRELLRVPSPGWDMLRRIHSTLTKTSPSPGPREQENGQGDLSHVCLYPTESPILSLTGRLFNHYLSWEIVQGQGQM